MSDLFFNSEWPESPMSELCRGSGGFDVARVLPCSVSGVEGQSWGSPTIVVVGVFRFSFAKCCLCLLQSGFHPIPKVVDRLDFRCALPRFKAHLRVTSGVKHEGGTSGSGCCTRTLQRVGVPPSRFAAR